MGLIRFLAIALIFYAIFKLMMRYVFPWVAKYVLRKASQQMQDQMNNQMNNGGAPKAEKIYDKGNVEIRKSKTSGNKAASAGDDEYVDFEEVKD
jgi:hypothetical protein